MILSVLSQNPLRQLPSLGAAPSRWRRSLGRSPRAVHVEAERQVMRWTSPTRSPNHSRSRFVSPLQDLSWADSLQPGPQVASASHRFSKNNN